MPQIAQSEPYNNFGCWDFRGYTGPGFFDTKLGVQPSVVKAITERLMATPELSADLEG